MSIFRELVHDILLMRKALKEIKAKHCKHTPGKEENFERGIPLVAFQSCLKLSPDRETWCEACIAEEALTQLVSTI